MKQLLTLTACFLFTILHVSAQDTLTPECKPGRFYAISSTGSVYAYSITGNIVTNDGQVIQPAVGKRPTSLAVAALNGSRRFYATDNFGVLYVYNNKWDTVYYDNTGRNLANIGGYNNYLYGHGGTASNLYIDKFNGTSFTNIINQPSFSVADVVVNRSGQVIFFGRISNDSSLLQIANPDGSIVTSYRLKLEGYAGYGCFLIDDVLYVGYGAPSASYPNSLVPITINGTSATVGTAIPMPVVPSETFYDLASCGELNTPACSNPLLLRLNAFPNPVNAGGIVDLSVTGNRAFTVTSWQPGTLFPDQTAITQNIILTTPVTITVSGKTTDGCYDTTTVSLTLGSDDNVWIPNAFTPDNSGYNDFFYVHGSSIVLLELSVWNKYGQMIFNTKSRNAGWDGTYKGKPQPQGTYVFTATIILSNGTELKRKGTVILLR